MGQILLVRHGQASFGAEDYDVLSEAGWAQGRLLGAWLAERGTLPTRLVRGDMRRHRETLEAMLEGARVEGVGWDCDIEVDPGWDEFDHLGLMQGFPPLQKGHTRQEFQAAFEQATAVWAAGEPGDYPETFADFVDRVRAALERAFALAASGSTAVIVSSGGPIAISCAQLIDPHGLAQTWARFNTVTVNSSVTRVVVGSTGARLLTFNEHAHLTSDHLTYR